MHRTQFVVGALALTLAASSGSAQDGEHLLSLDHYVRVKSTAPDIAGQSAQIYVREVVLPGIALRGRPASGSVVLFVHGAGTPAEVSFDVPYRDYSWMAYLAQAGFDVFSMDMTGYGRSTRPPAMNDPCNLSKEQQARFIPQLIAAPCAPSRPTAITTMGSDWNDIGAVVDHLRALRGVDRVSLVAWSQGGPRAGGYAARNPGKVARLVVLAPAYNRTGPLDAPNPLPSVNAVMNVQSHADFTANWDRQVGCPDQYEPAASAAVWREMLASDPVGSTWGTGVRRAPQVPTWGFNQTIVSKMQTPFLMVAGVHDKQVTPERVRDLYTDLGAKQKVLVDLACSSHNAMWERNHLLLFRASLEWLRDGQVNGMSEGELKLGYEPTLDAGRLR
jgi:pimeloyl-ACP methyl ester carboxylesterase